MKWVLIICCIGATYIAYSQSFYKTSDLTDWTVSSGTHILSITETVSSGYSESNSSPQASGGVNRRFENCGNNNQSNVLVSPIINATGRQNIRIGFGVRGTGTAPSVSLEYFNGSTWNLISSNVSTNTSSWSSLFFDIPSAGNVSNLQFRFSFTTTNSSSCTAAQNTKIDDFWVGANFKLPIQLVYFDVSRQKGKPTVTWSSLSEQNNHYYSLERSTDAKVFTEIKKIHGFGTGTTDKKIEYKHIDLNPLPGTNYYRLRQVDLDGTQTIYPSKSIFIAPEKTIVFPTLFQRTISVLFKDPPSLSNQWQLINTNGQLITRGQFSDKNVQQEIHFGDLVPGVYSFLINGKEGKQVFKLIKT